MRKLIIGLIFILPSLTFASTVETIESKTCAVSEFSLPVNASDDLKNAFLFVLWNKGYVDYYSDQHSDDIALVLTLNMNTKKTTCESCAEDFVAQTGKRYAFQHNILVADFKAYISNYKGDGNASRLSGFRYSESYNYMSANEAYMKSTGADFEKYVLEKEGDTSSINDFLSKVIVGMDSSLPKCIIANN